MVLTVLAVLSVMVYEFQFNTQAKIDRSALTRDDVQANQIAHSAFNMMRALLHAQKTFVDPMQRQIGTNIQLWNLNVGPASIDFCRTELLRTLSSGGNINQILAEIGLGALTMPEEKKKDDRSPTRPPGAPSTTTRSGEAPKEKKPKSVGFLGLPFQARCTVTDEDRKFNLNKCCTIEESKAIVQHVLARLQGPEWEKYFQERDPDGQTTTREDLAAAIVDWMDTDTERIGGGYEESHYQSLRDSYKSKNAKFDSIKELHLVRGMSDKLMREVFEPDFTVYGAGRVNVTTASRDVVLTLIRAYAKDKFDRLLDPNNPTLEKAVNEYLRRRDPLFGGGIKGAQEFVDAFKTVIALDEAALLGAIDVQSRVFRIEVRVVEVVGDEPNTSEITRKKVTAILDNGPPGGKLLYWREE